MSFKEECGVFGIFGHPEAAATVYPAANGTAHVTFDEPQHAVAPGQAVVFYDDAVVLGGGWIDQPSVTRS